MERLVIGHSSLKGCLTPAIADMRKTLKVLHCDSNELDDFPIELAMCTQLRVLDATENCFKRVPECVLRLRKLRLLTFSQNIELGPEAPNDILTCLPNLTHLGFYGCALQRLPTSLISVLADDGDVEIFANVSYNNYPPGMSCILFLSDGHAFSFSSVSTALHAFPSNPPVGSFAKQSSFP